MSIGLKKTLISGLLMVIVFFVFSINVEGATVGNATKVSTQTFKVVGTHIPIYDINSTNAIGYLREGEIYHYLYKDNNYFYIQIENANGRVKNNSTIAKDVSAEKLVNKYFTKSIGTSNTQIYTTKATTVYNELGRTIAQIPKDRRMNYYGTTKDKYYIYIGNVKGYINKLDVGIDKGIPIITYHGVVPKLTKETLNKSTYVSTEQFTRNMNYLKNNGYTTITISELESYLDKKINLSKKSVIVTFDDGLTDTIKEVYPIMLKNNQIATQFIITGRTSYPTYANKTTMEAYKKVFKYEGHTHNLHNMLTDKNGKQYSELAVKTVAEFRKDLQESKKVLPNQKYFAYPFGITSGNTRTALKGEGFTLAFTVNSGYVTQNVDRYLIPRFSVYQKTTDKEFENIIKGN